MKNSIFVFVLFSMLCAFSGGGQSVPMTYARFLEDRADNNRIRELGVTGLVPEPEIIHPDEDTGVSPDRTARLPDDRILAIKRTLSTASLQSDGNGAPINQPNIRQRTEVEVFACEGAAIPPVSNKDSLYQYIEKGYFKRRHSLWYVDEDLFRKWDESQKTLILEEFEARQQTNQRLKESSYKKFKSIVRQIMDPRFHGDYKPFSCEDQEIVKGLQLLLARNRGEKMQIMIVENFDKI